MNWGHYAFREMEAELSDREERLEASRREHAQHHHVIEFVGAMHPSNAIPMPKKEEPPCPTVTAN